MIPTRKRRPCRREDYPAQLAELRRLVWEWSRLRLMAQMLASPRHGAEIQVLRVRLAVDIVASGVGDDAQLGLRPARVASTSSPDWKRAASVSSARTRNSSIRRKIDSQAGTRSASPRHGSGVTAGVRQF
jgi:hypothetical protein